jgi:hypothetical protein
MQSVITVPSGIFWYSAAAPFFCSTCFQAPSTDYALSSAMAVMPIASEAIRPITAMRMVRVIAGFH